MAHPATPVKVELGDSALAQITVTSKICSFWQDTLRLWFAQFEAAVANQKLSDESKFHLALTKLNKERVEQAGDIILNPPDTKKYDALKVRLLSVYEESDLRRVQKLLKEQELGEQKPSQLLRKMKGLARQIFPEDTIQMLWMGYLPISVRTALTVTEITDLEKLAAMADKLMETTRLAEVSEIASSSRQSEESDVKDQIAKLTRRFEKFEKARAKGSSRSSFQGRDNAGRHNPNWQCFYHYHYKDKATKCIQPCAYKEQAGANSSKN